ncbi:Hypothetical protein CINCED_3A018872 [Cinara cedri]|uniref:Uncharacterized protein n=1 Tax=Cinara cedri TaxID=506608 RepID=A0A5E4NCT7_9HEMI|nr:Hypothetical protein CINCED_3A018872 [Cinara cedri]
MEIKPHEEIKLRKSAIPLLANADDIVLMDESQDGCSKVCAWLDKFDEDVDLEDSDDSDADLNFVPDNVSDLRYNNSENDDEFGNFDNNTRSTSAHEFYFGKDEKTKWYKNFLTNKTKNHNILTQSPSVVNVVTKNATSILDC